MRLRRPLNATTLWLSTSLVLTIAVLPLVTCLEASGRRSGQDAGKLPFIKYVFDESSLTSVGEVIPTLGTTTNDRPVAAGFNTNGFDAFTNHGMHDDVVTKIIDQQHVYNLLDRLREEKQKNQLKFATQHDVQKYHTSVNKYINFNYYNLTDNPEVEQKSLRNVNPKNFNNSIINFIDDLNSIEQSQTPKHESSSNNVINNDSGKLFPDAESQMGKRNTETISKFSTTENTPIWRNSQEISKFKTINISDSVDNILTDYEHIPIAVKNNSLGQTQYELLNIPAVTGNTADSAVSDASINSFNETDEQINTEKATEIVKLLELVDWNAMLDILHDDKKHEHDNSNTTVLHDKLLNDNSTSQIADENSTSDLNIAELCDLPFEMYQNTEQDASFDYYDNRESNFINSELERSQESTINNDNFMSTKNMKLKSKCVQIEGRNNFKTKNEPIFSASDNRVDIDAGIRRQDIFTTRGQNPLIMALEFNDRFLPVPMMASTAAKKQKDMLSALISATNPLTYMFESAKLFSEQMRPVMNGMMGRPVINGFRSTVRNQNPQPMPQKFNTVNQFFPVNEISSPASVFSEQFPPFPDIITNTLEHQNKLHLPNHDQFDVIRTVTDGPSKFQINEAGNRLLNIKIPTPSGKSSMFEINLMGNGFIGVLPVNEKTFKREIPTLTLENMIEAASTFNNPFDEIHITETSARNIPVIVKPSESIPSNFNFVQENLSIHDNEFSDQPGNELHKSLSLPQHLFSKTNSFKIQPDINKFPLFDPVNHAHTNSDVADINRFPFNTGNTASHANNGNSGLPFTKPSIFMAPSIFENPPPANFHKTFPEISAFNNPQINSQTNPLFQSFQGSDGKMWPIPPLFTRTTELPHLNNLFPETFFPKSAPASTDISFGSDPNVYYIDITIPDTNGAPPVVQHGQGAPVRSKRSASQDDIRNQEVKEKFNNRINQHSGPSISERQHYAMNHTARLLQYTGWNPVNPNDPLRNEPTVSYKPPPLQKVHFGKDPPTTEPLYPIVPKNPPVYVVRKEKVKPEIDEVYGTENIEYLHIEPQSKTIKAFHPAGNARIIKFVKKVESVKSSDQRKRSHLDPNVFFPSLVNKQSFETLGLNFANDSKNSDLTDLDISYSENQPKIAFSHPFLRILPPSASGSQTNPSIANARGILPSNISPQQLLQARLNLARLPLMTPLHGFFGSFSQIPLGPSAKLTGSLLTESPVQDSVDYMEQQPSEPVGAVLFARSKHNIERSDYFDDIEDNIGRITVLPSQTRFANDIYKPKTSAKSITANRLSDLLQIFKYTNATEPPPLPTTTPPPVTIMKGFRYTKPTELPPTTTTTRPTTTKRFRLPTAVRYSGANKPDYYVENTLTTTSRPLIISRITVAPALTPNSAKRVTGIPDLIFDRVAETNSLDGYLFSDSEASPEYRRAEMKPKLSLRENSIPAILIPKAVSSKRVSIRILGNEKEKDELIHFKNSEPLKSEFEIIYSKKGPTPTIAPNNQPDAPFTIIQGHSKVSVFRPDNKPKQSSSESKDAVFSSTIPSKSPALPPTVSTMATMNTFNNSTTLESHLRESIVGNDTSVPTQNIENVIVTNHPNYDYYNDDYTSDGSATGVRSYHDYPDMAFSDVPSYLIQQPWIHTNNPTSKPSQVSFTKLPAPNMNNFREIIDNDAQSSIGQAPQAVQESLANGEELFSDRYPQIPTLHFLEGLRRSMPTSAIPTTWQDLHEEEVLVTRIPDSVVIRIPDSAITQIPDYVVTRNPDSEDIRIPDSLITRIPESKSNKDNPENEPSEVPLVTLNQTDSHSPDSLLNENVENSTLDEIKVYQI